MTDRARDGPRRIVLWANDVIVGILTARNRKRRVRGFDGAEIHTMPTPRDVDGAISLFSAIFGFPSEVRTLRRLARTVPWTAVVLVLGERVEGYCFFRIYPRKRAILLSMAVDPERTGRGYGRAMLSFALDVLENAGIRAVELEVGPENVRAQNLYLAFGFKPMSPLPRKRTVTMTKTLTARAPSVDAIHR